MIRLHYPLRELPGYHLVHGHLVGTPCLLDEEGQGRGCRYLPTELTRLRQRALRLFRPTP